MPEQHAAPGERGIRAIVTDIEGTVGSIDFVRDTLFPYAREHLAAFVEAHGDEPEVRHWLQEAAREGNIPDASRAEIVALLRAWIDADRKATALKALQGMIWQDGYEGGAYRAHVYPEVAAKLRGWRAEGIHLYVYSSGSVAAQKLFFKYSEAGDLAPLFAGWFDTETGPKREAASYAKIAEAVGEQPAHTLFLSDITAELDAASTAGLCTTLLCRPPMACPAGASHPCVVDFAAIVL